MKLSDYQILLINNGLMFSPYMTQKAAHKHITSHPKFAYKEAAL